MSVYKNWKTTRKTSQFNLLGFGWGRPVFPAATESRTYTPSDTPYSIRVPMEWDGVSCGDPLNPRPYKSLRPHFIGVGQLVMQKPYLGS